LPAARILRASKTTGHPAIEARNFSVSDNTAQISTGIAPWTGAISAFMVRLSR
jgi:hypothetical protein